MSTSVPIRTLHLFPVLDQKLLELLRYLSPAEWGTEEGTIVTLEVSSEIGGAWTIIKANQKWELIHSDVSNSKANL